MKPRMLRGGGAEFAVYDVPSAGSGPLVFWAHGWGHDHAAFVPLAEAMRGAAPSILVDFPGFGQAAAPPAPWGTADYADAAAELLAGLAVRPLVWVGHSFGCRVGLQAAARHPGLIDGLFLIAAAGLPRQRSLAERLRRMPRRLAFRLLRGLAPEGPARERLRERFGSADYRAAGALRATFVKVASEDLSAVAAQLRCPTVLVYGERDSETPPEIGARLQRLIPGAELAVLRGLDHWTVLSEGRHQIAHRLSRFIARFQ